MDIILYGIPNCDTVKKARAWLADGNIDYRFPDFKKAGVSHELVSGWLAQLPWQSLVNTRGTTWRGLAQAQRDAIVDADSAIALMLAAPSVIKRPVLAASGSFHVGFSADLYQKIFSDAAAARQQA
jgi:arsenate reductase